MKRDFHEKKGKSSAKSFLFHSRLRQKPGKKGRKERKITEKKRKYGEKRKGGKKKKVVGKIFFSFIHFAPN